MLEVCMFLLVLLPLQPLAWPAEQDGLCSPLLCRKWN